MTFVAVEESGVPMRAMSGFRLIVGVLQIAFIIALMSYPGPKPIPWLQQRFMPLWDALIAVIFPPLCVVCKAVVPDGRPRHDLKAWFCDACLPQLSFVEKPYCERCGEMFDGAISGEFRCYNCADRKLNFDFAIAACPARDAVREIIHSFKYGRRLHLRGVLAALALRTLEEARLRDQELSSWLLVPVPLHAERETDREYNQSWEICQRLAQMTDIPAANVLQRQRATTAQAKLNRAERQQNLRGAFRMLPSRPWRRSVEIKDRRILLLDDVFTTGATTDECARVLRRDGGAEKVVVITVARG